MSLNLASFGEVKRLIGEGSNGKVYHYYREKDEQNFAIKFTPLLEGLCPSSAFLQEAAMGSFHHPGLTPILGAGLEEDASFLVYPKAEEDLLQYLRRERENTLTTKRYLFQAALGLAYLHSQGLMHGDIKPANILLFPEGAKLGDFGSVRPVCLGQGPPGLVVGTIWYRAPELLLGGKDLLTASDVWAFGCVLYEAWTKCYAFPAKPYRVSAQIDYLLDFIALDPETWPEVTRLPEWQKAFLQRKADPDRLYEAIDDPQLRDLLEHIFVPNPERRYNILQVLIHPFFAEVQGQGTPLELNLLPQLWIQRQLPHSTAELPLVYRRWLAWLVTQCLHYQYRIQSVALMLTVLKHYLPHVRPETVPELLTVIFAAWVLIGSYTESYTMTPADVNRSSRGLVKLPTLLTAMKELGRYYNYNFLRTSYYEYVYTQVKTPSVLPLPRQPLEVIFSLYLEAATNRPWPTLMAQGRELAAVVRQTTPLSPSQEALVQELGPYQRYLYLPGYSWNYIVAKIGMSTGTVDHTFP